MQPNWETFQAAYQSTSPEVKAFIDSEEIGIFIEALIQSGKVPMTLKPKMLILISDYCLGIKNSNELGSTIVQLGIPFELSHQLYSYIITFLVQRGVTIGPTMVTPAPPEIQNPLSSEIYTVEQEIVALNMVRTMAHDMDEAKGHPVIKTPASEVVYQSSQEDILQPAAPAPVVNETPRWDTETRQ
jgi:hypothetical protein